MEGRRFNRLWRFIRAAFFSSGNHLTKAPIWSPGERPKLEGLWAKFGCFYKEFCRSNVHDFGGLGAWGLEVRGVQVKKISLVPTAQCNSFVFLKVKKLVSSLSEGSLSPFFF